MFAAGKPRPGVIVQAVGIGTPFVILVCPFSTTIVNAPLYRLTVEATGDTGLRSACQIMADKVGPVSCAEIGLVIGRLRSDDRLRLNVALATLLDLGS